MKGKILGIFSVLTALCVCLTMATADPWWHPGYSQFLALDNIMNLLSRTALRYPRDRRSLCNHHQRDRSVDWFNGVPLRRPAVDPAQG